MAADTYMTISGNLTAAPKSGTSTNGVSWTRLRLASTTRVLDRAENAWRDGETLFLDVVCWRRLAENAAASLERGDRVLVSGRVRQRSYEDTQGSKHTVTEIEAESVGPDLVRHPARLLRSAASAPEPPTPAETGPAAEPVPVAG